MILSCDDGCKSDVRLADLCRKYEIECVFYWPVNWHSLALEHDYMPLSYTEALSIAQTFEIGSHSITHRHLTRIAFADAKDEIIESKFMLENMFNQKITKFCPPRGYTNSELTDCALQVYESQRLTKGSGLVHVHPNSGVNNNLPWRQYANEIELEELWMHSWELDKFDLWAELEEFLKEHIQYDGR